MPQKKFVVTGILVFDFELFVGGRCDLLGNIGALFTKSDEQGIYMNVDPVLWHAVDQISAKELDPMG